MTKAEQLIKLVGEQPPIKIQKLFWDAIHDLIEKDIENEGQIFRSIDDMMKTIEKGKTPSCVSIINAIEQKLDLLKEIFRIKNGSKKKPDWKEVLKELKKYK